MDRGQAWNEIVQQYDQYLERHQDGPTRLKLPVRYACNLMLEGRQFWGDFYTEIQNRGIRALSGQRLLGMEIEIVLGQQTALQVQA